MVPHPPDDPLRTYRAKRDAARTPEPVPSDAPKKLSGRRPGRAPAPVFVIQEHHARALHWDFRLERDGVLVSWAVPKGLPLDRGTRRLAVQTEDHPMEYAGFEGDIPAGAYGAGSVIGWDRGTYECEKWSDKEVTVVLHGARLQGRYVLIHTGGAIGSCSAPSPPTTTARPCPRTWPPCWPWPTRSPPARDGASSSSGTASGPSPTSTAAAPVCCRGTTATSPSAIPTSATSVSNWAVATRVLDGEIVAFDDTGRPSFGRLQGRMHVADATKARRLAAEVPVAYLVFDLLFLDGRSLLDRPYAQRRQALESLALTGPGLAVPPSFAGGGDDVMAAAVAQGLEGVLAKRLDSPYRPGRRSREWIKVKHLRTQEVVIVGWVPGQGRRHDVLGALLMGVPGDEGLEYAGRVGTGFTDAMLVELHRQLLPLERPTPAVPGIPPRQAAGVHWVEPRLVGEVVFSERTADGRLRQPSWRGLRPDKGPEAVGPES